MTQKEALLDMFRKHNGWLTLSEILNTNLAAEYRARITDLRKEGYVIKYERGKRPSENVYTLFEIEPTGQLKIFCEAEHLKEQCNDC